MVSSRILQFFVITLLAGCASRATVRPAAPQDDWQLARELRAHTGPVETAEYSVDGSLIASAAAETIIWDARSGLEKLRIPKPGRRVAFSPDATHIVICTERSRRHVPPEKIANARTTVSIHATEDGRELFQLPEFNARVCLPAFSTDGRWLATAPEDGTITIWNALDGSPQTSFQTPERAYKSVYPVGPRMVAFSKDDTLLGIAYLNPSRASDPAWSHTWGVAAWNIATGDEVTLELTIAQRAGLNPDTFNAELWGGCATSKSLPWNGINRYEHVYFHDFECILAFTSPDERSGLTTHVDGCIRQWVRQK